MTADDLYTAFVVWRGVHGKLTRPPETMGKWQAIAEHAEAAQNPAHLRNLVHVPARPGLTGMFFIVPTEQASDNGYAGPAYTLRASEWEFIFNTCKRLT